MKVILNKQPLRDLQRQLGELEKLRAQVGLFPETAGRSVSRERAQENPGLGFIHEFGNPDKYIPERSFLRMPLMQHLAPSLQGKDWFKSAKTRGAKRTAALLGAIGEDVVQEAFASRGFGQWPELRPRTVRRKKSSAVLIETAQLRKAISSRVV